MSSADLPEIRIVRHVRATRLRLRVGPDSIRLTAPLFCTKKQIQQFIDQSEPWLLETWHQQQQKRDAQDRVLPDELHLFNVSQPVSIIYQTQKQCFIFDDQKLQLQISDRQPEQYLKAFVVAYAKHELPLYLQQLSRQLGLKFGKCAVRQPRTRWGSCSARHDIMLNSALVLFPEEIARYVCVHELAHTRYFDHSSCFWAEVEKHDVHYRQHRKTLKTSPVPYWWHSEK
ncbi:M48 family metallopeptidase [Acinetobacter sp. WZC-1]|uniref:M48 family metallopeptidase n=1 Tax=Acinetobacter sp. WZC-1 TaxID=3459034 RepID=UPI00403E18D1